MYIVRGAFVASRGWQGRNLIRKILSIDDAKCEVIPTAGYTNAVSGEEWRTARPERVKTSERRGRPEDRQRRFRVKGTKIHIDDTQNTGSCNSPPVSNACFFESIGDELRVFVLCDRFAGTDEATTADIIDPEEETIY